MPTTLPGSHRVAAPCGNDNHPAPRHQRVNPALQVVALVIVALSGIAQASPRPPIYHVEPVQEDWSNGFLYSVNANGVAAGYFGSVSQAIVWQDGVLRQLNCKNEGSPYAHGYAINDAMQVAGSCYRTGGGYAVVWDAQGNPTRVQDDAVLADTALGINNLGHVVGTVGRIGYVWKGAKVKLLGTLGGTYSTPQDINDNGVIVGSSAIPGDTAVHAFVYRNGQMKDLNWPWANSYARAVNAHGHIAGWSGDTPYTTHAILDNGITITDLGRHTSALGINNLDQVVGTKTVNGDGRAFVYTHQRVYDLNTLLDPTSDPDWDIRVAYDINDAGVIVGWGILHGSYQPVVLTPLP
jgi:probable HAF family extracellular repeat protein